MRLNESEEERRILQEKLLNSQKDWETKVSSHNSALVIKQQQRVKHLESLTEDQANTIRNLELQLRQSLIEREKLTNQIS